MGKSSDNEWQKTNVANLIRYVPSGVYFARFKAGGKLFRFSLKTTNLSVAKQRLPDEIKNRRNAAESIRRSKNGTMRFGDALKIFEAKLEKSDLKPNSKKYRRDTIAFMTKLWPALRGLDISRISDAEVEEWFDRLRAAYAPSVSNNTLGTFRKVIAVAIEAGAVHSDPSARIKRARIRPKRLTLPTQEQFREFVKFIADGKSRDSQNCADLVEFLAFSGMRIGEAKHVNWADIDFDQGQITIKGDPETGTKNSEVRRVPMIEDMHDLLSRVRERRGEYGTALDDRVMCIGECQHSMDRGAKLAGMDRITHHDLRHLFATRAIESGVDVPTVARWLGHKDGGALAMKTYGHLRDDHSREAALKVRF